MTNKIVILDNSIELYEHYIDDTRWERTLAFPRGGVTYLVSNGTIKFYAYEDYLYRNCLISMQLPIRVVDEFEHIDGEYEDIDELAEVLDRIFPTNDLDAELADYLRIKDAELLYQPKGDYILRSEVPDLNSFVTDDELAEVLDDYYTKDETSGKTEIQNALDGKADKSDTYTKAEVDDIANGKANVNDVYTKREADSKFQLKGNYVSASTFIQYTATTKAALANKAERSEIPDMAQYYTKSETSGSSEIQDALDLKADKSDTYTKAQIDEKIGEGGQFDPNRYYTKVESDSKFQVKGSYVPNSTYTSYTATTNNSIRELQNNKLDITAYTPCDLSDYYTKDEVYTKSEVYNKNEISDKFQPKGNYVSASTYTSFTSSTEASIERLRDTKLDISAYTPSDLSNYYTKSEVYSKSETYNKNEIDDKITQSGTFDPTRYYTKGTCDSRFALKDEIPSLDGYATEDWVTSKNYATNAELVTYVNNLQQQINSLMATVSGCCGTQEDVYRWITIIGEYLCEGNDKYEKQKYQVSNDGGITWEDVTPIQYQKGQLIESDSTDCGYAPEPQYRWQKADTSDYMCSGTSKYYKLYYEVSYDGGQTWQKDTPEQTKIGGLIEANSSDCGYITPQYRWLQAPSTDYVCVGYNKCYKEYYQVSYDDGQTWENVSPEQTRSGSVFDYNSEDCGYQKTIASVSVDDYFNDFDITSADDTISRSLLETKLTSTQIENIILVVLFDGCNHIANGTFQGLTNFVYATLGNVKTIGDNAYNGCTRLHSVVRSDYVKTIGSNAFKDTAIKDIILPETLTSIGDGAFSGCGNLLQIFMHAKTPPTIGDAVFDGDNMLTEINVPAESVDAYKAADGWKDYASLIKPINS